MSPLLYQAELRRRENSEGVVADRLTPSSIWWRGRDLNPRPLGYEPNELPDCSTPRCRNECIRGFASCQTRNQSRIALALWLVLLRARVGSEPIWRNQRVGLGGYRNDPIDEISGTDHPLAPRQRFERKQVVFKRIALARQLRMIAAQLGDPLLGPALFEVQQTEVVRTMVAHEQRVTDERSHRDQKYALLTPALLSVGERPTHDFASM